MFRKALYFLALVVLLFSASAVLAASGSVSIVSQDVRSVTVGIEVTGTAWGHVSPGCGAGEWDAPEGYNEYHIDYPFDATGPCTITLTALDGGETLGSQTVSFISGGGGKTVRNTVSHARSPRIIQLVRPEWAPLGSKIVVWRLENGYWQGYRGIWADAGSEFITVHVGYAPVHSANSGDTAYAVSVEGQPGAFIPFRDTGYCVPDRGCDNQGQAIILGLGDLPHTAQP